MAFLTSLVNRFIFTNLRGGTLFSDKLNSKCWLIFNILWPMYTIKAFDLFITTLFALNNDIYKLQRGCQQGKT